MRAAAVSLVVSLSVLVGCDDMSHQPRYDSYEKSGLFADGKALQAPPAGTVSRDATEEARQLAVRPPMTTELLDRGREQYAIFCTPCHDASGSGQGAVVARGFPHPPSFHIDRLRQAPSRYFVDVITHGHGVMYSYASRIGPGDRWAIAAYLRALQFSQNAPIDKLPAEDKVKLAEAKS